MFNQSLLSKFKYVAVAEGISYLLLLFIAMPLKYWADFPHAVTYIGWVHGFLFVLFIVMLLQVWAKYKWSFGKTVMAFVASIVPFGTFVLEKSLNKEIAAEALAD